MRDINASVFLAYATCPRQGWFLYHSIESDQEHELLFLGRLVHETSYARFRKEVFIDQLLKIDLFKDELLAEVKKSSKHKELARLQLGFYLYYLKKEKGLILNGILLFPKERKTEKVFLTPELERKIEEILEEMKEVLSKPFPPPLRKRSCCKSCSYLEVCWG
ncbi:MAG: CRISPR-associated protein Cas4 [Synergistetes bacterium]|nr:CRISPR-associated protein Cas4 [Synergistota bacterium]